MIISIVENSTLPMTIGAANTNSYNVDLRQQFQAVYPYIGGPANVDFTVLGNIGSTSTSSFSLTTGTWPTGSKLKLILPGISGGNSSNPANGVIAGKGGQGQIENPPCCDCYGCNNVPIGGPAIQLLTNLDIVNNGIIGSGGQGSIRIAMNRDRDHKYSSGGGAGINPGEVYQSNYGSPTPGTYLYGGYGSANAGNLGQSAVHAANPYSASVIVTNGNTYTLTGAGQFLGTVRSS
jgi:hypothetical protein